jgi:hypothetical protein
MATKKKAARKPARKAAPKRKAPAKRKAVRRVVNAPMPALAKSAAAEPPKRNGYILIAFVAIVIAAVFLRSCRENGAPQAPAPAAPAAAAPEGRRVAPAPAKAAAAPQAPAATATAPRRETAGEHAGETDEPAMEFDRAQKDSLKIRAWRPAKGQAQVDVFGPRNQRVRSLKSEAGEAGWQTLRWDGKDESGKAVPGGLYYVRPSSQGLQQVRDVWVKG